MRCNQVALVFPPSKAVPIGKGKTVVGGNIKQMNLQKKVNILFMNQLTFVKISTSMKLSFLL